VSDSSLKDWVVQMGQKHGWTKAESKEAGTAERERLSEELKPLVLQTKDLAANKDPRAAEAAGLSKQAAGFLGSETLEKAKEKIAALKALLSGKAGVPEDSPRRAPKSNAEISLDEFVEDLEGAIGNVEKMTKVAKQIGVDELADPLEKIGEGLTGVKDKADKLVELVELVRDIQEFRRALQTARSLDLNRDYEAAAQAMGDLANIGGKLAKKAAPKVPGLDAYITLFQNAGAIWEMGARIRKRKEAEADVASREDGTATAPDQTQPTTRVAKASGAEIPLDGVAAFMQENMKTIEAETKWNTRYMNEKPDWSLSTDHFQKAFAVFKPLHDKRKTITLGPLSSEYRQLSKEMQAPYDEAMRHLQHLQDKVGKAEDLSANYEPAMKAMKRASP